MQYVNESDMNRFERVLNLKGLEGGKEFLREYFTSRSKMGVWDESRKLRVERIEEARPCAAEEFEAFIAEYTCKNEVSWHSRVNELMMILQEEKEKRPFVYNHPLRNDKEFNRFLREYGHALAVGELDWTLEDNENRIIIAENAWKKLKETKQEFVQFCRDSLKDIVSLSEEGFEAVYEHLEKEVEKKPTEVDKVFERYKKLIKDISYRVEGVRSRDELKFFDTNRNLLERKKNLLELVMKSEEGILGGLRVGKKRKAEIIAELDREFVVKFTNTYRQGYEALKELGNVREAESALRSKDEARADLAKLVVRSVS